MRFEIGDTFVDGGSDTCILCDEEYNGILDAAVNGAAAWKQAKLAILEAVLFKLAYQVDTKIDVLQYNFSDRAAMWKKLHDDLKDEINKEKSACIPPSADERALNKPPYFYTGMQENQKALF